jgi:glycosyltransferase involved in cell wall biosynthesis
LAAVVALAGTGGTVPKRQKFRVEGGRGARAFTRLAKTMRILYLHQYYQTRAAYGATRSYEVARDLVGRGHRVTVVTGDRSYQSGDRIARPRRGWLKVEEGEGIRVMSVGVFFSYRKSFLHRAAAFAAYFLLSVWAGLRSGRADVVLATSPPLTVGLAGVVVSFLKGAPLVFEVRDLWPEVIEELGVIRARLPLALLDAMASLTYRFSRRVVAVTPGIQRWLVERRGLPEEKVKLVTQGSDLDLFDGVDRATARAKAGLGEEFVVVYAGAIGVANRIDVVVEAMRHVGDSVRCLIIGEGMEKERLQGLARGLGLNHVVFMEGMPRNEVVWQLAAADIGLISLRAIPVFGTALPNKFFDYIAAGLAVVVNFAGDVAELVEREGIGKYGGDNDPRELARVLRALEEDREGTAGMGARARELAETAFNRGRQCERLYQVLAEVAGDSPG